MKSVRIYFFYISFQIKIKMKKEKKKNEIKSFAASNEISFVRLFFIQFFIQHILLLLLLLCLFSSFELRSDWPESILLTIWNFYNFDNIFSKSFLLCLMRFQLNRHSFAKTFFFFFFVHESWWEFCAGYKNKEINKMYKNELNITKKKKIWHSNVQS